MRGTLIIVTLAGLSLFTANAIQTASVKITWTPSLSTNVAGYDIYYGTASSNYTHSVSVSNVTDVTVAGLTNGTTYYFAAKSYTGTGVLSLFSQQIAFVAGLTSAIPATISSPIASQSGQFGFLISGSAGYQYAVEASTNLVNWVVIGINTAPFAFVDTNASQFPHRFYRAVYAANLQSLLPPMAGQISSGSQNASGYFSFTVSGTTGSPYAVEASTNLVNWIILATNNAPFVFVDTNASHFNRRFYRAVFDPGTNATGSSTASPQSPAPAITASSLNTTGHFGFTVSGITGYPYVVEASTNLVNWTILETNAAPFDFVDTNAVNLSRRFYRAVYFPN
jgi:hypothetical protein